MVPPERKPPTLDEQVLNAIESVIRQAQSTSPRAVIIESASERFFCVGANLNVLKETNEETIGPWVRRGHEVLNQLEDLPCPVLAKVSGYALGGGLELAMACDMIFATEDAVFGQTEAKLGFIPGWGGSFRLAERIGISAAKRYFFTGEMFDAQRAGSLGLVDWVGSDDAVEPEVNRFIQAMRENNLNAIRTFKKMLNAERNAARERCLEAESNLSVACVRDADTQARLQQFLSRSK